MLDDITFADWMKWRLMESVPTIALLAIGLGVIGFYKLREAVERRRSR